MTDMQMGFPQISQRFVDPKGNIEQTWLQLLIQLWRRTGAELGQAPDLLYDEGRVLSELADLRDKIDALGGSGDDPAVAALNDRLEALEQSVRPQQLEEVLGRLDQVEQRRVLPAPDDLDQQLDGIRALIREQVPADLQAQLDSLAADIQSARSLASSVNINQFDDGFVKELMLMGG